MRVSAALIVMGALSAVARSQVIVDAHGDGTGLPMDRAELYDGLMIATALGVPMGSPLPGNANFIVQRFLVKDSRAFSRGTVVNVYFQARSGGGARARVVDGAPFSVGSTVPSGSTVLLYCTASQRTVLRVTDLADFDPRSARNFTLPDSIPSAFGEAWYHTAQSQLMGDTIPKWRLLGSLAAAIPGTSDENVRQIADLVARIPDHQDFLGFGGADDRLSHLFSDAVASDTPYHRALVHRALNKLAYWGYADRFRRDLREAADDSNAFPEGVPRLDFYEDLGNNNQLPKGFRHDPPLTDAEAIAILGHAKSPTIAAWLLRDLDKPSAADQRTSGRSRSVTCSSPIRGRGGRWSSG